MDELTPEQRRIRDHIEQSWSDEERQKRWQGRSLPFLVDHFKRLTKLDKHRELGKHRCKDRKEKPQSD